MSANFHMNMPADFADSVLCIRHGLTEWNASYRWQGRADIALAEEGIAQAQRAAVSLAGGSVTFTSLVSSPLQRAFQTATLIGEALGVELSATDERLMERDIGEWSGHTTTEIEARWPGMLNQWRQGGIAQLPGGETETGMTARVMGALTEALSSLGGGTRLMVAHGGVLRALDSAVHAPLRQFDNLEGRWFHWRDGLIVPGNAVTLDPQALRFGRIAPRGNAL